MNRDLYKALRDHLIARLSVNQRRVLMLWYVDGLNPVEIAEVLGRSIREIESMHAHLVRRVRRSIDAYLAGRARPLWGARAHNHRAETSAPILMRARGTSLPRRPLARGPVAHRRRRACRE